MENWYLKKLDLIILSIQLDFLQVHTFSTCTRGMAILQKLSSAVTLKDLQNIAIMNKYLIILLLEHSRITAQYNGTASVSQGKATTTVNNLYTCDG